MDKSYFMGHRQRLTAPRHTWTVEQMGKGSQATAIAGVALLCGFATVVLTLVVLFVFHSTALLSSCSLSPSGKQYACTPQTWRWVVTATGVLGTVAGGVCTSLAFRHQTRSHDNAAAPVGQLADCVAGPRLESRK